MRISDWSSDVCSSDLRGIFAARKDNHMAAKKQKDSSADLRTNEKKWTKPLMDAGWTALPSVIIENQRQLMLSPLDLNIIVYLASKWWTAEGKPFPSKTRSEEHTSELKSLMRISYAVFCLKKKTTNHIMNSNQFIHTPLYSTK